MAREPPALLGINMSERSESETFLGLRKFFPLFFVLLLSLAIRIPSLHVPLDRDEGGFAYIAWDWHQGHLPYRDAFDNKPPLLYLSYRFAIALFGATPEAIHLFFLLLGL